MPKTDYSRAELLAMAFAIFSEVERLLEHNCLCRHSAHEHGRCFWESPGGDLIGQFCECDEYRPCPHLPEHQGTNSTGGRYCRQCAQHFKDTDLYKQAVANVLGISIDQVTPPMRAFAKEVSFGARFAPRGMTRAAVLERGAQIHEAAAKGLSPTGRKKL